MASSEVVIVGAGAVGCATAHFLTRRGLKPIVVERHAIADHASGFAFGGLTPFNPASAPGPEYPLLRASLALHTQLAAEIKQTTGIDSEFRLIPYLGLALDEAERERLVANLAFLNAEGYPAVWLDAAALRGLEPRLAPEVLGAVRIDGSGIVESYKYTLGLAQSAEQGGAQIRHGEVQGLQIEAGRVVGVTTARETIPCRQVVLAGGPWSGQASAWTGTEIPIFPLKGQIVRLRLPGNPLECRFSWRGDYFATKSDGMIWAGTTEEKVGFDERTTDAARDTIITTLARVFPPLMEAEIVQQTACLRPVAADGLPLLGPVPGLDGLFIATGGARRGIVLSAAMGKITADLLLDGRTELDIAPFSLARFAAAESPGRS